jgi:hypothetical protein
MTVNIDRHHSGRLLLERLMGEQKVAPGTHLDLVVMRRYAYPAEVWRAQIVVWDQDGNHLTNPLGRRMARHFNVWQGLHTDIDMITEAFKEACGVTGESASAGPLTTRSPRLVEYTTSSVIPIEWKGRDDAFLDERITAYHGVAR